VVANIQPAPDLIYVAFSAEINPSTTESLIATMANCANAGAKEVCLLLSTPGGTVMNGMNLYNVLLGMPFKLTIHNVGNVDSIGNAIFLAGAERYAAPHATFMFHGVGFNTAVGDRLEEKSLRERLGSLEADQRRIGAIIAQRSGLSQKEVASLFLEAQTKDATWAAAKGVIHEIREVKLTPGAPIVPLVFQR